MLAAESAAITHGHELGYIPAAALAHIVRALAERDISVREAVTEAAAAVIKLFPVTEDSQYFADIIKGALNFAASDISDIEAIDRLGGGWVAEETIAISVFCAVRYENDLEKALIVSVNHDGDSDSTGAVTGNILGAKLGYDAVPGKFINGLELHDVILGAADELYSARI